MSELKVRSFNSDTGCGGTRGAAASAPDSSSTQYDLWRGSLQNATEGRARGGSARTQFRIPNKANFAAGALGLPHLLFVFLHFGVLPRGELRRSIFAWKGRMKKYLLPKWTSDKARNYVTQVDVDMLVEARKSDLRLTQPALAPEVGPGS